MKSAVRSLFLMSTMLAAAAVTWAVTPRTYFAADRPTMDLAKLVPKTFGDWVEVPSAPALIVDPGRQQLIAKIYSESLSRVYVNSARYAVMLSIAYGRDQRDGMELHQPEVCYPAQGFSISSRTPVTLDLGGTSVQAVQMDTRGPRPEPLTYWTVVGEHNYLGGVQKKLSEMRYGFSGKIPDGMLVRISSVDAKADNAYLAQADFAKAFAAAVPEEFKSRIIGSAANN